MSSESEQNESDVDWSWTDSDSSWIPPEVDTQRPSPARMYDYALDGKDNFDVDRAAVDQIGDMVPGFREVAQANRSFLVEAVRILVERGITQFVDIGAGLPTSPNVHEVAQQLHPEARVVYVDNDPIVMAHTRALRSPRPGVLSVHADMREPRTVLDHPHVRQFLDFEQPIGLLFVAVLHFVRREVAVELVRQFHRAVPAGSYVVISAVCADGMDLQVADRLEQVYSTTPVPLVIRTTAQIHQLFDGLDLIEPDLCDITRYSPHNQPLPLPVLCGIGQVNR